VAVVLMSEQSNKRPKPACPQPLALNTTLTAAASASGPAAH
jgi:hypothetical protein